MYFWYGFKKLILKGSFRLHLLPCSRIFLFFMINKFWGGGEKGRGERRGENRKETPNIILKQWNQTVELQRETNTIWFHLYMAAEKSKSIEKGMGFVATRSRDWGVGNWVKVGNSWVKEAQKVQTCSYQINKGSLRWYNGWEPAPVQGTQVWSLVQEDPTHPEATEPMSHTAEPVLWSRGTAATEADAPRSLALQREAPAMRSPGTAGKSSSRTLQLEKACAQRQRPSTAKIKIKK